MDSESTRAEIVIDSPDRKLRRWMMTLFLVQHGKAKPETEDPERSVTEQGAEVVGRMADWAAQVGLAVDQIQHSGKRRAEQTATSFAKRLNPPKGVIAVKGLSPKDDVKPVAASLRNEQGSIMLAGRFRIVTKPLAPNETEVGGMFPNTLACVTVGTGPGGKLLGGGPLPPGTA
jgi:phosphohistidine phosphatase